VQVKIAVVTGDDVMPLLPRLRAQQPPVAELQSSAPLPARVVTANAYLGARPIQAALDAGAQIVITGRCVDSAVTLGILMHEFGWQADEFDRLAGGSLAGHIIECGCQGTGGLHTDWQAVPDWAHIGYPIVECERDGSFTVTKPAGTGGLVAPQVVAEQMLYEIHDPAAYLLPDVVCDFTQVTMVQTGPDRVRVTGARGLAPTGSYKVSATYLDGYKTSAQLTIVGLQAVAKARRTGEAIFERVGELLAAQGLAPLSRTHLEVLGAESGWGPLAAPGALATREAVLRLTACHADKRALELLAREIAPAGTSFAPGTTGAGGRASVSPLIRQYAFLLDKAQLAARVVLDGVEVALSTLDSPALALGQGRGDGSESYQAEAQAGQARAAINTESAATVELPLIRLAWARSGDKGDTSNIGVIARRPEWLPLLRAQLTPERVKAYLAHAIQGRVTRHEVPGIAAFNFVCEQALGGGGMASLNNDALGKGMAQMLLTLPVRVPADLAWNLTTQGDRS
jgi:hypothetical protein